MSPTWLRYKELVIYLVEPLQDQPCKSRRPHIGEEKKDEGSGDPIKIFLEEALEKKRNMMMEKVSHILQRLPAGDASTSNNHSGGANLLEGYFSVQYIIL